MGRESLSIFVFDPQAGCLLLEDLQKENPPIKQGHGGFLYVGSAHSRAEAELIIATIHAEHPETTGSQFVVVNNVLVCGLESVSDHVIYWSDVS